MQGLIGLSVALAAASGQDLTAAWQSVTAGLAEARLPVPVLDDADFERIAAGEVVAQRVHEDNGIDRVIGVAWMDHSQDEAWLAFHDDAHMSSVSDLVEEQLAGTTPQHKVLYQHANLPMPLSDRHWVLNIENNPALFEATGGRAWERTWVLDPRGTAALADVPDGMCLNASAIWTPYNEGGYWLLPVSGGTLMVYQVRFDAGGYIPDELVVRGTVAKMDEMMAGIDERADSLPTHYVAGHTLIERPNGTAVPLYQ